jgi:hypothetical protein
MVLDKVVHFNDAGLEYIIIGDRKVDFWNDFLNNEEFRKYALCETIKRFGYEVKAIFY